MKIININADKSHGILEKCGVLKEYSYEDELEVTRQEEFEMGEEKGEKKGEEKGIILAEKSSRKSKKSTFYKPPGCKKCWMYNRNSKEDPLAIKEDLPLAIFVR